MKLLIVTCLKEDKEKVARLFEEADVTAFSATETTGYKAGNTPDLITSWFASEKEHFNSCFLFSFTLQEKALKAIELIKNYNNSAEADSDFPVRAFVVPVEQTSMEL
jgi:hypothetical protein